MTGSGSSGGPLGGAAVSLVVVLHDSAGPLPALLASLGRLPVPPQLVVVDTGSTDEGPALARAAGAEVVALEENPGFGAANNAGIARARHPVTVLLNPDCELLDGSLARLAARAAEPPERLWVPRLLETDGSVQRSAHPLPGTVGALLPALAHPPILPRALRERAEPYRAERPRSVGWAIAACVVAPTATLRRLGPFDPRHFLFFEDMDLCLRARAAGVPTVLDPSVRIRHVGGHATRRAYAGEPHELLARRRREVVAANRGSAAAALDDLAQVLTFATRAAARRALGREPDRERAQLAAILRTRGK
ncbi:MAG TPA: glycosyltransferase [Solirubrobacteraceae bacterium]|nr:glycosyltransferase [Solirubrobacteraceae bacterium]